MTAQKLLSRILWLDGQSFPTTDYLTVLGFNFSQSFLMTDFVILSIVPSNVIIADISHQKSTTYYLAREFPTGHVSAQVPTWPNWILIGK